MPLPQQANAGWCSHEPERASRLTRRSAPSPLATTTRKPNLLPRGTQSALADYAHAISQLAHAQNVLFGATATAAASPPIAEQNGGSAFVKYSTPGITECDLRISVARCRIADYSPWSLPSLSHDPRNAAWARRADRMGHGLTGSAAWA